ncbi:MAG: chemotaxis protein CheC [Myxococcaceae bacterium]
MIASAPSEMQLDALREVANIGCAHAVSALSRLVGGRKVQIDVPRVLVAPVADLPAMVGNETTPAVAAQLGMQGELSGQLLLVMPQADAAQLSSLLLEHSRAAPVDFRADSALGEAANIVASACLSAIGTLTRLKLLPSVPRLSQGPAGALVAAAIADSAADAGLVVVLEARFQTELAPAIGGRLLVLPERESLAKLLSALGV